ncbi:Prepilin-type N-terminal cleavage/methylation domain-containing protein OS=Singulisphaera acidiphila (strain ATCC BAA-1392 / DSM 18658 / VKM B-2454 / MOB10) GN=Sinac_0072 PE=4 SV=1: N_methyl: SBP_bac_10: SBP_bac_10 [Gemmata massiliana]|uniref:DUF1559 domain-containing protein n=1 Tax=Gemmata massiliana TaxID=1210884 RepID=A0A6P2D5B2_9BACT|nr:DUF1559 domain-containing protein [Gemmata massiliana]VTR96087.1 Prepilin-type N-terminal cleavage/methylation domain-containing protein OS=Singulisphaera acidiphila (strain ATCC BAA-1392 / DSM 18658 / VKM B-2454 / MOB10) GN=Sinac_0072 PE=4 SV=1: N_methyl: SBP_bac_10: SBP_bac_10 [Gemmata massiliana]
MSRSTRHGFSLIEVLVIFAIIAILFALTLPATRRVQGAASRMKCSNNLKQLMLAVHSYSDRYSVMPPLTERPATSTDPYLPAGYFGPGKSPDERLSWSVALLPYLEQDNLFKRFDVEQGYAENLPTAQTTVPVFLCPSSPESSTNHTLTNYVAPSGIGLGAAEQPAGTAGNGFMGYDRRTSFAMIKDGTSNTIALMETRAGLGPWARGGPSTVRGFDPADAPPIGDGRPFGEHGGGANVAMVDGSVRFVSGKVAPHNLAAAITIAGGEPFDLD